jgi:DNA-binding IclR family transcriptional regulator
MKTSPTQQIVKLINEQPNLRAGEIIKTTGIEDAKVYRTLSYLVKTKKLNRRAGKYTIAYGLPMTAITPEEKQKSNHPRRRDKKRMGNACACWTT